ncbi:hypothetical protein Pint_21795 [Pistacia integerrima]|uniref:Uncharacterized protein n=1 Tax=Pistacia integerrima TaxID=434235 RepID=A0ACC0XAI0_9ROSI|nr:hypothetical protein Pint_21795 [Pistacia integerrima]
MMFIIGIFSLFFLVLTELYISSTGFIVSSRRTKSDGYVSFSLLFISSTCASACGRSLLTSMFVKMLKTAWVSGLIQTALYADFFYYYFKSWKNRENLKLPD